MLLPFLDPRFPEGELDELPHGVGFTRADDIVIRLRLLEHPPHRFDVFWSVPPVSLWVEISELDVFRLPFRDHRHPGCNLPRQELQASPCAFVVKQYAVRDVHPIRFSVVRARPVCEKLRDAIRRPRMERGVLVLGRLLRQAEQLGGGGLIDPRVRSFFLCCLEETDHPKAVHVRSEHGLTERRLDERLSREVVNLVGLRLLQGGNDRALVRHVSVKEVDAVHDRLDVCDVRRAQTTHEAVDVVTLREEEFREKGPVLARDPGNQDVLGHKRGSSGRGISAYRGL